MKRSCLIIALALLLLALLALGAGCKASKPGEGKDQGTTGQGGEQAQQEYQQGLADGVADGYRQGYNDGKAGNHAPAPQSVPGGSQEYADGYEEGYYKGYENGYGNARAEITSGGNDKEKEEAVVEAAMISFVKQNAVPGLEFRIENLVIHDGEAAGVAVCTSERLENALVVMKKGSSGWYGVDFGTGIEPPSWYKY